MHEYGSVNRPIINPPPVPPYPPPPFPPPPANHTGPDPLSRFYPPHAVMPPNFGMPWHMPPHMQTFLPARPQWGQFHPNYGQPGPHVPNVNRFMSKPQMWGSVVPGPSMNGMQGVNMQMITDSQPPNFECQTDKDKRWVLNFVENCERSREKQELESSVKVRKTITISQAKELHVKAHQLIDDLKVLCNVMKESTVPNDELLQKRDDLKRELDEILAMFSDEQTLRTLEVKVLERRKKRQRVKRNRLTEYTAMCKKKDRIADKHKQLDEWISHQEQQQEEDKREKEVQKQLDQCLQDVRQKQAQLKKTQDLINSLAKLRKVRADSGTRRMIPNLQVNDEVFSKAHETAQDVLASRIRSCDQEEQALRQFLAEERKMQEEKIKLQKLKEEEGKRNKWNEERWDVLFGASDDLDAFNPMWPIQELHKQASCSLLALVNTRRQWDQFVVGPNEDGSSIPLKWVEPVPPSNNAWKQYLEDKS